MNPKVLYKISYGVYIVSSKLDSDGNTKFNGQIANTVFQTTAEPQTIAVCINKQNLTYEFIQKSKIFSVSILSQEAPIQLIGQFGFKSGREIDKFKGVNYKTVITGAPLVLDNTVGYLEAEVVNTLDIGTHTLFIGKIVGGEVVSDEEPMTYAYYHLVKQGKSPKTAPTYIEEKGEMEKGKSAIKKDEFSKGVNMQKYKCTVCGYIYDPEKGDPDSGIKPGTPFEKVPNDWVCPICGAGKEVFEEIK